MEPPPPGQPSVPGGLGDIQTTQGIPARQVIPARRYDVERSCIRCHERKVRCDKTLPCTRCIRSKVPCRYPDPERVKRRPRKTVAAEVAPRLVALEKVVPRLEALERAIVAFDQKDSSSLPGIDAGFAAAPGPSRYAPSSDPATTPTGTLPRMQTVDSVQSAPSSEHSGGFLVREGSSSRYINEVLFSRMLEKESDLRSAVDTPHSTDSGGEDTSPMCRLDGLLSSLHSPTEISSFHPTRRQAMQLWQVYLNNVDPLIKIFHVPTTQTAVYAAISNLEQAPPDVGPLLFSVYFAAVTSVGSTEIHNILGQDRQTALHRMKRGLELSLNAASFLDSPTVTSLQAMSLYLMCHRNHNAGRSGWILNGLLLRAAQSIGLHRDGEHFHFPPLECEIRRRLWWMIIGADARVAEDHGLMTAGFDSFSDTKLPLNVDDRDLWPGMETPPVPKPRWTEMSLFLVTAEMNSAVQQVSRLSVVPNGADKTASLEQLFESVRARMQENYLKHCDTNIPIQKATYSLVHILLGKLEIFVQQQYLRGLGAEASAARASEETLAMACDSMVTGIATKTDELLSNFHWLFTTYTQYHLLTYILWHLCVRPDVPGAERAWRLVDQAFELAERPSRPNQGAKWSFIRKLREKALLARRRYSSSSSSFPSTEDHPPPPHPPPPHPLPVENAAAPEIAHVQQHGVAGKPYDFMAFRDGLAWDDESVLFPEWVGYPSGFGL